MERLVAILAPRGRVDFVGKAILFVLLLGALNMLRDVLSYGDGHDSYLNNLYEAAFVGAPFVLLSLAMVGHLNGLQIRLAKLAATDMLTGLPNRRAFMEAVKTRDSDRRSDVLMMIDVDHFKRVNDTFGHAVGDICLQHLADCFRDQIRESDFVARMGGEEFAVLLEGTSLDEALPIADRIANGGQIELDAKGQAISVTTSVGLAVRRGSVSIDKILQRADEALYRAKAEGRACYRVAGDTITPIRETLTVA